MSRLLRSRWSVRLTSVGIAHGRWLLRSRSHWRSRSPSPLTWPYLRRSRCRSPRCMSSADL